MKRTTEALLAHALALASCALTWLALERPAHAREGPALDDEVVLADDEDVSQLADEALDHRGTLRTRAETVSFDAKQRMVELSGNVRVDAPPFHLRSQHIRLSRTKYGIEVDGKGRLAFCPCLGTPLTVEFEKAIVAPPGDLILKSPTLEFYGVPFFHLPWFWLRGEDKLGVLPPDLAYRGQDGVFVGGGVHIPWKNGSRRHVLDLRGGAYVLRGFATDLRLQGPASTTKIRYDRLPGATSPLLPVPNESADASGDDGLLVDARGAIRDDVVATSWDVDLLRGRRGVTATTDLDTAAKPWDRASAEASARTGPLVVATGARVVSRRGGGLVDVEAGGPVALARIGGAIGGHVTYDVTAEGGAYRLGGSASPAVTRDETVGFVTPRSSLETLADGERATLGFVRAEGGAAASSTFGPLRATVAGRGAVAAASEGRRDGTDRAAAARVVLGVPLARRFDTMPAPGAAASERIDGEPLVHVLEPYAAASILDVRGSGLLGALPGRVAVPVRGTAPITDAGLVSTFGRWGKKQALEIRLGGGAAYGGSLAGADVRPLVRGRLGASLPWLGATADTAHVLTDGDDPASPKGSVFVTRLRLGAESGPRLLTTFATRDGIDPVLARALGDLGFEPTAGFVAREGVTGGTTLVLPWSRTVTTTLGGDADAKEQEIVGARVGLELRDRCGCITLRSYGSHRLGRNGVDVWLALDFAADR